MRGASPAGRPMGEGRVFVGRVVGAYAHPQPGQATQQPRGIVHRDAEKLVAPPVHGLRHDIERKSAAHFRPKPLDRRDEERPHLALAQPSLLVKRPFTTR